MINGNRSISIVFVLLLIVPFIGLWGQGIAINQAGAPADLSAIVDISSQQKGLLIPRLTTTERNGISQPAKALLIYNTTTGRFEVNTGSPGAPDWEAIATIEALSGRQITWNQGGNILVADTGLIGSANAKSIGLITNNIMRLYVDSTSGRIGINTRSPKSVLHIASTDALLLPVGTTAQRPATPLPGMIRYNAETGKLEGYTTEGWKSLQ